MPEARQIGFCLAIVGLTLAVQGCWEEERLALLGDGGCRTADDRHGDHVTFTRLPLNECQALCFDGDAPCTAIEYTTEGGVCEVHSEPITKFEKSPGGACYVAR